MAGDVRHEHARAGIGGEKAVHVAADRRRRSVTGVEAQALHVRHGPRQDRLLDLARRLELVVDGHALALSAHERTRRGVSESGHEDHEARRLVVVVPRQLDEIVHVVVERKEQKHERARQHDAQLGRRPHGAHQVEENAQTAENHQHVVDRLERQRPAGHHVADDSDRREDREDDDLQAQRRLPPFPMRRSASIQPAIGITYVMNDSVNAAVRQVKPKKNGSDEPAISLTP